MKAVPAILLFLAAAMSCSGQLPRDAVLPKERFEIGWTGENWVKAKDESDQSMRIIEYIRKGGDPWGQAADFDMPV
jgi:hypothetical protein